MVLHWASPNVYTACRIPAVSGNRQLLQVPYAFGKRVISLPQKFIGAANYIKLFSDVDFGIPFKVLGIFVAMGNFYAFGS